METICLEDLWRSKLQAVGWSTRAIDQLLLHWAPSTLKQYNGQIQKLYDYCLSNGCQFPPTEESIIASYLCDLAAESDRPRSQLNTCLAALKCMYSALGVKSIVVGDDLSKLVDSLVKSATRKPMARTAVMPITPFVNLFMRWPVNSVLDISRLRLKVICLLALVFMLRPSDVAPRSKMLNSENHLEQMSFGESQVQFNDNGSLTLMFHGIKNDTTRDGFTVTLPPASEPQVDPIRSLKDYMDRTAVDRAVVPSRPVFLSLTKPYHALSAGSIARILKESIDLAGLGGRGYTAKCFRPTGATNAIALGLDPDLARHIGRWRSAEVFEKHYVHSRVPDQYTDDMLLNVTKV